MSNTIVIPDAHAVKHGRYVAPTAEAQNASEFALGRKAYRDGKRRGYCFTEAMTAGWDAAFDAGEDVYHRCMVAQASDTEVM
jgi:hypothetical protein